MATQNKKWKAGETPASDKRVIPPSLQIEIPMLPSPKLNINARIHWGVKAKATKECREAAGWAAMAAKPEGWTPLERAEAWVTLVYPGKGHVRDFEDNLRAMLKPFLDGLVDAGIIVDDTAERFRYSSIRAVYSKERSPLTIIEVKEAIT